MAAGQNWPPPRFVKLSCCSQIRLITFWHGNRGSNTWYWITRTINTAQWSNLYTNDTWSYMIVPITQSWRYEWSKTTMIQVDPILYIYIIPIIHSWYFMTRIIPKPTDHQLHQRPRCGAPGPAGSAASAASAGRGAGRVPGTASASDSRGGGDMESMGTWRGKHGKRCWDGGLNAVIYKNDWANWANPRKNLSYSDGGWSIIGITTNTLW